MGLTQTKLHHKVLQENWGGILRRLRTEDGKQWVRTINPCGDYPLHLACYGGRAPPIVIRALITACPEALDHANDHGFKPLDLARSNYREGHPFRGEVLAYLETSASHSHGRIVEVGSRQLPQQRWQQLPQPRQEEPPPQPRLRPRTQRVPNATSAAQHKQPPPSESAYMASTTCVVCLEHTADHIVVPCGHLCLCGGCAHLILESNPAASNSSPVPCCPVCRSGIDSVLRVYSAGAPRLPPPQHRGRKDRHSNNNNKEDGAASGKNPASSSETTTRSRRSKSHRRQTQNESMGHGDGVAATRSSPPQQRTPKPTGGKPRKKKRREPKTAHRVDSKQ